MPRQVVRGPYALALRVYRRLPRTLRILIIRRVAPGHTVGALALIEHDGRLLMLRQRHRNGWTFPGGLINRGETAAAAVEREVVEETGLQMRVGLPFATVVEPRARRVDVLYWVPADAAYPVIASGEALEAGWVAQHELGTLDEPTSEAMAEYHRFRAGAAGDADPPHVGRMIGPG